MATTVKRIRTPSIVDASTLQRGLCRSQLRKEQVLRSLRSHQDDILRSLRAHQDDSLRSAGAKALPNVSSARRDAHGDTAAKQQRRSAANERKQPDYRGSNRGRGHSNEHGNHRFMHGVDVTELVGRKTSRLPVSNQRGAAGDGERGEGTDELKHKSLR
jgi:hypothetical protein